MIAARFLGRKGQPGPTSRVFDAMYEDDIDGGQSNVEMYRRFKIVLCRLRKRLAGSDVAIECAGYRRGWKLVLNDAADQAGEYAAQPPAAATKSLAFRSIASN